MQLADATVPPVGTTSTPILDTISRLLQAGAGIYSTVRLGDLNSELIRQGKPPLTPAQASSLSPQINVGVAQDTQTLLTYAGLGIGALFLISMLSRR